MKQELLGTIQLPQNLVHLKGRLPKAQYDDHELEIYNDDGEDYNSIRNSLLR